MALEGTDRRFGVVIFDDTQDDPGNAIATVTEDGVRTTYDRISGPHELATDVLWWSNLPYEVLFRKTEMWKASHLRHDKYLPVGPGEALREWGCDLKYEPPERAGAILTMLFFRVMNIAFGLLRENRPRMSVDEAFKGKTLRDDMRGLLPEFEYPRQEAAQALKRGVAYEEFTNTMVRAPRDTKRVTLRIPRLTHAWRILEQPAPQGPFEFVDKSRLRRIVSPSDWVVESEKPVFSDIAVKKMDDRHAPIFGFGNATNQNERRSRNWIPQNEFTQLSKFADLVVRGAYVGETYGDSIIDRCSDGVIEFMGGRFSDFSWSAGIVAEALWRAAALPEEKGRNSQGRAGEERPHTSWQGVWVRGFDKGTMFVHATRLMELGYPPVSYGIGWVRCAVFEEQKEAFIRDAVSLGLVPQFADVPEGFHVSEAEIAQSWGGDKKMALYVAGLLRRDTNFLWDMDRLITMDRADRTAILMRYRERFAPA
ncbi:hypothetical protein [Methylorubrum extorquens]|uniref:Uncharacterized protein n=1 Tax=Methylorubrum extorquens DSM 13060 TaxID=882800 RepID=H1KNB6_METEX|nr:hypothetical protein [Methylorubrum extorquens]EHP90993.1 hypothetical protein MetexDRAFT_4129 [Methylorubrum extorquens DSM 13060]OAH21633.1 hypothetical protein AX289_17050 [Methylorubrum populi]